MNYIKCALTKLHRAWKAQGVEIPHWGPAEALVNPYREFPLLANEAYYLVSIPHKHLFFHRGIQDVLGINPLGDPDFSYGYIFSQDLEDVAFLSAEIFAPENIGQFIGYILIVRHRGYRVTDKGWIPVEVQRECCIVDHDPKTRLPLVYLTKLKVFERMADLSRGVDFELVPQDVAKPDHFGEQLRRRYLARKKDLCPFKARETQVFNLLNHGFQPAKIGQLMRLEKATVDYYIRTGKARARDLDDDISTNVDVIRLLQDRGELDLFMDDI